MSSLWKVGRWRRAAVALLALAVGFGAAAVAAPATPAYAGGGYIIVCFPVYDNNGNIIGWSDCVPIPMVPKPDPTPECPECRWSFGFDHRVLPADPWYLEDVLAGLVLLGKAAGVEDPREAAQLRGAAREAFLGSAERLGEGSVGQLREVGIAHVEENVIEPVPQPWLVAAGTDVGDGLTLMQQALAEPDPTPWLEAGMAEFEEAYQEIAQQQPVGE